MRLTKTRKLQILQPQGEILGPTTIGKYRKPVTKRMKNDNYMDILAGYTSSII